MTELNDFVFSDRRDFARGALDETTISSNPANLFEQWLRDAIQNESPEPYAFTLVTNSGDGYPSARVVYLRTLEPDGSIVFFTNYSSQKGRELQADGRVAVNFFWSTLERQVRIKGDVSMLEAEASDMYFDSRPEESKLGAWASDQSEPLESREKLLSRVEEFQQKFNGQSIPRPPFWGGFIIKPVAYEFWQGRSSRLHDRFRFEQDGSGWKWTRLAP